MDDFSGRTAIVTGASRGIGLAVATLFAERGAGLVLIGRDAARLDDAAHRIGRGGGVVTVAGDVGRSATADAAIEAARTRFGRIDILANIAGAFPTALLEATTDEDFADSIASNLAGTFYMCRSAMPALREAGEGAIVNMSSMAARFPTPGLSVYSASKAGVEAFTRAIAAEVAPQVRVNAVSAGPTLTEAVRHLMQSDETGATSAVTRNLPLGRLASPEEIAETVLFLASRRASCITGQVVHANCGGLMA